MYSYYLNDASFKINTNWLCLFLFFSFFPSRHVFKCQTEAGLAKSIAICFNYHTTLREEDKTNATAHLFNEMNVAFPEPTLRQQQ